MCHVAVDCNCSSVYSHACSNTFYLVYLPRSHQTVGPVKLPTKGSNLWFAGASVSHVPSQTHTPPLTAAAQNGHVACLDTLLDWGAQVGFAAPDGTTALLAAAGSGHAPCVLALILSGADIDHLDNSGMSAMMLAAAGGHVAVLTCLMTNGAAVEQQSFQVGPCHSLLHGSHQRSMSIAMKSGAQIHVLIHGCSSIMCVSLHW